MLLPEKVVSGSLDKSVKIWDSTTGECVQTLEVEPDGVAAEEEAAKSDAAATDDGVDDAEFMLVACPEGVVPGQLILVTTPDGRDVEAEVPEGISAGDEFEVFIGVVDAAGGHSDIVMSVCFSPGRARSTLS